MQDSRPESHLLTVEDTSAYISIRQDRRPGSHLLTVEHTSAYVSIRQDNRPESHLLTVNSVVKSAVVLTSLTTRLFC